MGYLAAYCTNLYLSKDSEKVTEAIEHGKLLLDEYSQLLLNSTFSLKPFGILNRSRLQRLSAALRCFRSSLVFTHSHVDLLGDSFTLFGEIPAAHCAAGRRRRMIYGSLSSKNSPRKQI